MQNGCGQWLKDAVFDTEQVSDIVAECDMGIS